MTTPTPVKHYPEDNPEDTNHNKGVCMQLLSVTVLDRIISGLLRGKVVGGS
jgi:hypothetical protein